MISNIANYYSAKDIDYLLQNAPLIGENGDSINMIDQGNKAWCHWWW